jgi:hypothetical protein
MPIDLKAFKAVYTKWVEEGLTKAVRMLLRK